MTALMAPEIPIVVLGAFLGSVLAGAAGFAFAVVATAFWIHVLPPQQMILLASACATTIHIASISRYRKEVDVWRLAPFLLGAVVGVPVGMYFLKLTRPEIFQVIAGAALMVYAALTAFKPPLGRIVLTGAVGQVADGVIGFLSGIVGAMTSLLGVLPIIWCGLRGWNKRESRSVYQPFLLIGSLYVIVLFGLKADIDLRATAFLYALSLPVILIGLQIGSRIFDWISEAAFQRSILLLVFVSGLLLVIH